MATLDEKYQSAANSRDLSTRAGREGDVDALVAVAWNRSRVGAALMRLHSDWDGLAKRGGKLEQTFLQLKSLPEVRGNILLWAEGQKMEDAAEKVDAVLCWWLEPGCKPCNGTKWIVKSGQPKRPCTTCHGTGKARTPQGDDGAAIFRYMEGSMYRARASIRGRSGHK